MGSGRESRHLTWMEVMIIGICAISAIFGNVSAQVSDDTTSDFSMATTYEENENVSTMPPGMERSNSSPSDDAVDSVTDPTTNSTAYVHVDTTQQRVNADSDQSATTERQMTGKATALPPTQLTTAEAEVESSSVDSSNDSTALTDTSPSSNDSMGVAGTQSPSETSKDITTGSMDTASQALSTAGGVLGSNEFPASSTGYVHSTSTDVEISTESMIMVDESVNASTESVAVTTESINITADSMNINTESMNITAESMNITKESMSITTESMNITTEYFNTANDSMKTENNTPTSTEHGMSSEKTDMSEQTTAERDEDYFGIYAFYFEGNCSLLHSNEVLFNDFVLKAQENLTEVWSINRLTLHNMSCEPFRLLFASGEELNITAILETPIEIDFIQGKETVLFTLIDLVLIHNRDDEFDVSMTTEKTTEREMTNSIYLMTFSGQCAVLGLENSGVNSFFVQSANQLSGESSPSADIPDNFDVTQTPIVGIDDVTATAGGSDNNINHVTTVTANPRESKDDAKALSTTYNVAMETSVEEQTGILTTFSRVITAESTESEGELASTATGGSVTTAEIPTETPVTADDKLSTDNKQSTNDVITHFAPELTSVGSSTMAPIDQTTAATEMLTTEDFVFTTEEDFVLTTEEDTQLSVNETNALRESFILQLRTKISEALDISINRVLVNNLICGSVIVNVTILDTYGANFDELMPALSNDDFVIEVTTESNDTFMFLLNDVSVVESQTTVETRTYGVKTTESADDDDLTETEIILIIVFAVIGATLILLLVIFICYRCCRTRSSKSFTLGDTPSRQYDMEDFSLTKMNRPTPVYTDQGLIMNTELNSSQRPVSVYSNPVYGPTNGHYESFPSHTEDTDHKSSTENLMHSGRKSHNDGHDNLSFSSEDMLDPGQASDSEHGRQRQDNSRPEASSRM